MGRKNWIILLAIVLVLCSWAVVRGYPRPSPSGRGWQLKFEYGQMHKVRLVLPGQTQVKTFWYMPYVVTNNTGRDISFYPRSYLLTDSNQLIESVQGVDALAYPAIARLLGRELLEEELFVSGKLLQGEEYARESVIIFRDFDPKAISFKVFISGLSNESAQVRKPMTRKKVSLVKTLQLGYGLSGDRHSSPEITAELKEKDWIMR